eukprot:SAG11_NODE_1350_length_5137_cov_2.743152_7_plen_313_part_00
MFEICVPTGATIAVIGSAISLRLATSTGAGRGQLAALGAGEVLTSERARRSLGRAHACLCVLNVFWVMLSLLCIVTAFRVGTRSKLTGGLITTAYARTVFVWGIGLTNSSLVCLPWWLTLKYASVLVADAVAKVKQAIERYSPTSPEWEAEVLPHVLRLCDETLPLLSSGYGIGVAASFLGGWLISAGEFALFLENGELATASICMICVMCPLGIAYDAAHASSDCDLLSDALTKKRMRGDPNDQAFEHAVRRIELIVDRQNTKKGLGFTVGYRVLDLKTLGNIMAAIAGVATTAVPILFTLRPSTADDQER